MLEGRRTRRGNADSGPVFVAVNGKPLTLNNVQGRVIRPALRKAGLNPFGADGTRRGREAAYTRLEVPEKTIRAILRPANVTTTKSYYIKTAPADAVAAMHKMDIAYRIWATSGQQKRTSSTPRLR